MRNVFAGEGFLWETAVVEDQHRQIAETVRVWNCAAQFGAEENRPDLLNLLRRFRHSFAVNLQSESAFSIRLIPKKCILF